MRLFVNTNIPLQPFATMAQAESDTPQAVLQVIQDALLDHPVFVTSTGVDVPSPEVAALDAWHTAFFAGHAGTPDPLVFVLPHEMVQGAQEGHGRKPPFTASDVADICASLTTHAAVQTVGVRLVELYAWYVRQP